MVDFYRNFLQEALFDDKKESGLVIAATPVEPQTDKRSGTYSIPREMFPKFCEVINLPDDVSFFDQFEALLAQRQPKRFFLLPPWIPAGNISKTLHEQFGPIPAEAIALQIALNILSSGTLMGIMLPTSFLTTSSMTGIRETLVESHGIKTVFDHNFPLGLMGIPGINNRFRTATLILRVDEAFSEGTIWFHVSENDVQSQPEVVFKSLKSLLKGEDETPFGYRYKGVLSEENTLSYDLYDPAKIRQYDEIIKHFGEYNRLAQLVDFVPTLNPTTNAYLFLQVAHEVVGFPLLEGKCIERDGSLSSENIRYKVAQAGKYLLQDGDICVRAIHDLKGGKKGLYLTEITHELTPMVAASSVIVMRPKSNMDTLQRQSLLSFLRSEFLTDSLQAHGVSVTINRVVLSRLKVPTPGKDLRDTIEELNQAEKDYFDWIQETRAIKADLLNIPMSRDSRIFVRTQSRRARQRYKAAASADDFNTIISTRFPHPIAFRWKIIETSYPSYESYKHILECAEMTFAYLGSVAILLSRLHNKELGIVNAEAEKLGKGKTHGKTFGYWKTALEQTQKHLNATDTTPFLEVIRFPNVSPDEETNRLAKEAIKSLYDSRNDDAHGEGPKGIQVKTAYQEQYTNLTLLLKAAEFLSEYELRYIEKTQWNTHEKSTSYDYRILMGDHHLAPIKKDGFLLNCELEAGSLYIVDREDQLHLLRPLLSFQESARENRAATYYLNTYDPDTDVCELRSMELGDTIQLAGVSKQYVQSNLLKPPPA